VQATDLALDCLRAGANVWMEKPAAASLDEILELKRVSEETGKYVLIGLKKLFTPAFLKIEEIVASDEFGPITSVYIRYPQALPAPPERSDLPAMRSFLDHIYHPGAVLTRLLGPIERFSFEWEPESGSSIAVVRAESGAIGTLHFAAGISRTSPLERVEVIGTDANIIVDNGVHITYHRPGNDWGYGRRAGFAGPNELAPLSWEPEFSLGTLDNKNLFYLGYVPEVLHFCESVQNGTPPTKGTLDDAVEIMRLFEAFQTTPSGTSVTLPSVDARAAQPA
jgi:predicted dehydrogenase